MCKIDESTALGTSIKQAKQLQDIEFDKITGTVRES